MSFEIGKCYKDKNNNVYKLLTIENNFGIFKLNLITKRLKIIKYCGIDVALEYGNVLLKSESIKPVFDSSIDIRKRTINTKIIKLNNNNERYIDVFKCHR